MATILVTHGIPREGLAALAGHTVLIPADGAAFTREELLARIPDAEAVIAGGALDAQVIRAGRRLKIIANYGAGYDRVDVAQAAAMGIPVTNLPVETVEATAELTMALMLSVARRVGELSLRMRREAPETLFGMGRLMGHSLAGRRLGILGMGSIGGRVAELASVFGMQVAYHNRRRAAQEHGARFVPTLAELARQSDVLTIHCPATPQTRGMVNAEILRTMRRGAMLVNTSRGAVVDAEALADALESGQLAGVGLDVFPDEPHVPQRLVMCERAVLTPHIGTNTAEARARMAAGCAERILSALAGGIPKSIVNPG